MLFLPDKREHRRGVFFSIPGGTKKNGFEVLYAVILSTSTLGSSQKISLARRRNKCSALQQQQQQQQQQRAAAVGVGALGRRRLGSRFGPRSCVSEHF